MKETDGTGNYFIEETKQNVLIRKKFETYCNILNYTEQLLFLASTVPGCVSISAFVSLVDISLGIASSAVGTQTCAVSAVNSKENS